MAVRFVYKPAGTRKVMHEEDLRRDLTARGEAVERQAESVAPVVSGTYKASLRVLVDDHPSGIVVHVLSDVPYAQQVEAKYRVLGRSIDAAGG